jgi:hypothetical protein
MATAAQTESLNRDTLSYRLSTEHTICRRPARHLKTQRLLDHTDNVIVTLVDVVARPGNEYEEEPPPTSQIPAHAKAKCREMAT